MQPPATRHSPCPCGSGKMYKHCHGKPAPLRSVDDDSHEGAVGRAVKFLSDRHRKAFSAALDEELQSLMPEGEVKSIPGGLNQQLMINLSERLLAEGDIFVHGNWREVNGHLLGPDGPGFTPGQRRWIQQLGHRPLRLYTLTDVRPGEGLTVADALDAQEPPTAVREIALAKTARPGMLFGLRLMDVGDHWELSGALYPFSMLSAGPTIEAAKQLLADPQIHAEDKPWALGQLIGREWLREFVSGPALPEFRDASTGQPLLLVTDHYQLVDDAALGSALAACDDVVSAGTTGWSRDATDADGVRRPLLSINRGKQAGRIEVFYRTQALADEGRTWFEQVAGSAVKHLTRELTDPKGYFAKRRESGVPLGGAPATLPEGIDREELARALAQAVQRSYARWADEPIPALGGQTPRQAITTPAGLERVKGLLRSYADGEAGKARNEGRTEISYQFLWDQLGIEP